MEVRSIGLAGIEGPDDRDTMKKAVHDDQVTMMPTLSHIIILTREVEILCIAI